MVLAVTFPSDPSSTPADWAARVLDVTASAWQLAPRSAQALARRAPHGYVPRRARLRAAALAALRPAVPALAHSW
ncbi:hypothetical protein [Pseudorhodoferax sp. Leaf274]|uniref:hypothetical protein n=1 Tax=Pseudorhodoferax sp. Leaf274 TaxID=1736318 RepID=UPI000702451E|nr:hypothetical protein [Pseudorhodoferax sp. Leaf274]KQP38959.1 hypothetical protein ASF44_11045 [Pseudorhodoferax sp. Leaf274]